MHIKLEKCQSQFVLERKGSQFSQCAKLMIVSMFSRWAQPLSTDEKTEAVGVSE